MKRWASLSWCTVLPSLGPQPRSGILCPFCMSLSTVVALVICLPSPLPQPFGVLITFLISRVIATISPTRLIESSVRALLKRINDFVNLVLGKHGREKHIPRLEASWLELLPACLRYRQLVGHLGCFSKSWVPVCLVPK